MAMKPKKKVLFLRVDPRLYEQLESKAEENHRSLNQECEYRLEQQLRKEDEAQTRTP